MLVYDISTVKRQWGHFLQFTQNSTTTVKLLHLQKDKSISYQYHNYRSEQWYLISGFCWYVRDNISGTLNPGDTVTIPKLAKHKLTALDDSLVLEISFGIFDEDDIVHI